MLTATHNEGLNKVMNFPTNLSNVFSIGAADGNGGPPTSNPLEGKDEKFATLGVAVNAATIAPWSSPTGHTTVGHGSGSSVATPIAAGIAALSGVYLSIYFSPTTTTTTTTTTSIFLLCNTASLFIYI